MLTKFSFKIVFVYFILVYILCFARILCCGEGEPRKFFCEGNLTFEPSVMSFLGRGDKLEEDKVFMEDWADAVKMRGQVKQVRYNCF